MFLEKEKTEKRNNANIRSKNLSVTDFRRRKHMKYYYYKRERLLNDLINPVEELENVSLSK